MNRDEFEQVSRMARPKLRKMARRHKLIDEAFKAFQRKCYPEAPPEVVAHMRVCFYAGAAELFSVTMAGLDEGEDETEGDMEMLEGIEAELRAFTDRLWQGIKARETEH